MKKIFLIVLIFVTTICFSQEKKATKIFLIRHTETEDDGTKEPNRDPGLSEKGKERVKKWATILQPENITMVYSTNYIRTLALAKIIANTNDIASITPYVRNIYDNLDDFLEKVKGESVVVIGHTNTNPFFVNALIGEQKFQRIDDSNYGSLFIVTYYSKEKASVTLLKID